MEFGSGQFECISWSFIVQFGVYVYFSSLANGCLWFWFKLSPFCSLSLTVLGGRIGDLCKSRFCTFCGVACVGVVDSMSFCLNYLVGFLFILNLFSFVLAEIRTRVVFSGATETLANQSAPTGPIFPRELHICFLDWLYPSSLQQRRRRFLPYRTLLFSLFSRRTYSSNVSPQVFPFLFYRCHGN